MTIGLAPFAHVMPAGRLESRAVTIPAACAPRAGTSVSAVSTAGSASMTGGREANGREPGERVLPSPALIYGRRAGVPARSVCERRLLAVLLGIGPEGTRLRRRRRVLRPIQQPVMNQLLSSVSDCAVGAGDMFMESTLHPKSLRAQPVEIAARSREP
jgi:hypothetical protein